MSDLQSNTLLGGRYLIQNVIGKGGMGIVYRALDQETGGRPCAVKVLKEPHGSEKSKQRFEEEIRCVLKLHSPHIVRVFATGTTSIHFGIRQYVVMELVNGVPLSELLRGEPLGAERAIHVALGVVSALEVAHREGVVHRDLKPANIIVGEIELGGVVKILDFGIAKDLSREETLNLTRTGMLVGTPTYMSPERFQIDEPLTPAADLYSVGLLLYHMIGGHSPIYVKHPALPPEIARLPAPLQICWLHINYDPPLLHDCPSSLALLTKELLAKEPHLRPNASDTYKRLTEILEREYNIEQEPLTESLPQLLFDSVLAQFTPPPLESDPSAYLQEDPTKISPIRTPKQSDSFSQESHESVTKIRSPLHNQNSSQEEHLALIQTLMLNSDDMIALNHELDLFVADLGENKDALSPAPHTPQTNHAAHLDFDALDQHLKSTLKLGESHHLNQEYQVINQQSVNFKIKQPNKQKGIPIPPFIHEEVPTQTEIPLDESQYRWSWLVPVISLSIGALISYLLLQ